MNNLCNTPIAILTGPVSLGVRLKADDRRPFDYSPLNAYARVYVTREELLSENPYLGDGGRTVLGAPRYYWMDRHTEARVPIVGGDNLIRSLHSGRYVVTIETFAVPAQWLERRQDPFDIDFDVQDQNGINQGESELRVSVSQSLIQGSTTLLITSGR